jgi:hypothetical protein
MNDPRNSDRNPLLIPEGAREQVVQRGCPVCKKADYSGRISYGIATFKCRACGNEWQGGVGMVPQRASDPLPPENPKDAPTVDFTRNPRSGDVEEFRPRRPDTAPAFRRGALIKGDDEDV